MGRRRAVAYDPNFKNRGKGRRRGKVSVDVDATALTGSVTFYGSPTIPDGGYVITSDSNTRLGVSSANATPIFWTATDATLVSVVNGLPGNTTNITTTAGALEYLNDNDYYVISSTNQNIPTDGLVLELNPNSPASWPGTGDKLFDLSGNGNHATLYNSPTISGGFITWNGSNEYAQISFDASMAGWSSEQTIAMWLKHDYTSGRRNPWDQAYGGYGTWTHEQGNNINNYFGDAGRNASPYTSGNSSTTVRSKWNFLATTRTTSQQKWYNNANHVSTRNHSYGTLTTDTNVVRLARGYAGWWQGKMGPVIAYDKALTQSEITSLYYGGGIVTDGLVLALDAGNLGSFDQGETITYSLDPSEWNTLPSLSGSLLNGPSYSNFGGGSWDFDGSNDYIQLNKNLVSEVGGIGSSTEYTLEAWIYVRTSSGTTTSADNIIGHTSATGFGMQVGVSGGKPRINYGARSTSNFYSNTFEYNEWKHVVLTRKSSSNYCYTYLDGQSDINGGTRSLQINSPADGSLTIGGGGGRVSGYFDGYIAIVRVYDKALSSSEVAQNYNAQKSRFV